MTASKNAARVAVKAAACANQPAGKPSDVFDCIAMGIPREEWEASLDNDKARVWSAWMKQGESAQTHTQDEESEPVNLHGLYRFQSECGYDNDLTLSAYQVQNITRRLRGIRAITGVLMAAGFREDLSLGDYLEGGLKDAVYALACDADADLEQANAKARKVGAA